MTGRGGGVRRVGGSITRRLTMRRMIGIVTALSGLAAAVGPIAVARAQTFPAAFAPLHCQRGVMIDPYRDQAGDFDERDLVGTVVAPAGFRQVDANFLYLRLRLDATPIQGQALRPFGWGFEISTDGNPANYEILISVDGARDTVDLYRNDVTTVADSPADPADLRVASYPFAQNGRVVDAGPSLFAGGNDTFLDMAVPWTDLNTLGLTPGSLVAIWAGSSALPDRLDGDLACDDASGGGGPRRLSANPPAPAAPDPARGPGPVGGPTGGGGGVVDGGGGNQLGPSGIEGGPACTCTAGAGGQGAPPSGPAWTLVGALGAATFLRRRRRR
jgi:hypothetical protein